MATTDCDGRGVDPPERLVSGRTGLQDPVALGATGSCSILDG